MSLAAEMYIRSDKEQLYRTVTSLFLWYVAIEMQRDGKIRYGDLGNHAVPVGVVCISHVFSSLFDGRSIHQMHCAGA